MVENWGNLDDFAKQEGLDKAAKHPGIPEQLEAIGLKYDHTTPGKAFNPENEQYVPYRTINGEVII